MATGRYASTADLVPSLLTETVLAQLSQADPDSDTPNDDVVATWIEDAEAEVDTYLGARYPLPLTTGIPAIVTRLTARIVRYRAYTSRPGQVDAWLTTDYEGALKTLEAIASGKLSIGLTAAGATTEPGPKSPIRTGSSAPVYGRAGTKGF